MRNKSRHYILLSAAGLFLTISGSGIAQKSGVAGNDMRFAEEAARGGQEEVELGRVAVRNGSNDKVKSFGQKMIDDHSKAGDELKMIAAKNSITLPSAVDAKQKAQIDRLSGLSGAAFDRAYSRDMVEDHQKDIAAFEKESSSGTNPDLKNWATNTLPTLREHLRLAKEAAGAVNAVSSR